jgi:transposase
MSLSKSPRDSSSHLQHLIAGCDEPLAVEKWYGRLSLDGADGAERNGLRGLLTEYGEVMPQGRAGVVRQLPGALGRLAQRLPALLIDTLREQFASINELDAQILQIEQRLRQWHREVQPVSALRRSLG